MQFRLIDDMDALDDLVEPWRGLYAAAGSTPFQHPDWHILWWRTLGGNGGGAHGWRPHVVTSWADGELLAVCPFAIRRRGFVRMLHWAGEDVLDDCGILASPRVDQSSLWRYVLGAGGFDVAMLRYVDPDGRTAPALAQAGRLAPRTMPAPYLTIGGMSGAEWLAALPSRRRTDLNRRLRRMEEKGEVRFELARTEDEARSVTETLIDQKRRWAVDNAEDGLLSSDAGIAFLRGLPAILGDKLHLSSLTCGPDRLACHLGFVDKGVLYYYMPSFEAAASELSPGRVLLFKTILWAADQGLREVNFLRGGEEYKRLVATGTRVLQDYTLSPTMLGRVADKAWRTWKGRATLQRDIPTVGPIHT